EDTDWVQIAALYKILYKLLPSPVVELNQAVAVAMADGPNSAFPLLEQLERSGELNNYYLFHSARADLLRRVNRYHEAELAYARALDLCQNTTEQAFLRRRLNETRNLQGI
ncbi:MAG TPA: RNA polymerase subunit sigma-24, partial [Ktedonobacteraceae bacterium]|nr:RNA polymerase subunit sigma-24 [Ktedonobacteraceae bacterium]